MEVEGKKMKGNGREGRGRNRGREEPVKSVKPIVRPERNFLITYYAIVLMSEVTAAERLNSSTTGSL